MADNVTLAVPAGSGPGDVIRTVDRGTFETQVVLLDLGGVGSESIVSGGTMPVSGTVTVQQATAGNLNATVTGTVTANIGTVAGLALAANQTNGTQKTQLVDGSGNVVAATSNAGIYAVNTQLSGITFTLSSVNSSTAQLASGATFTGTIESAFNQPAAQLLVVADQNYTVNFDQYDGANNLVSTDTFTRTAGQGLNENVQVNGDACRIRVTNNGGSPTTTLRIETTYGPLPPLPRALTTLGSLKVAINEAIPAGSAIIGKVGIDQTTAGTTNAVSLAQIGATTVLTGGVAGSQGVGGLAASGATASGNPLPIAGTFNTTAPTVTTGQAVQFQATARGSQIVVLGDGTNNAAIKAASTAAAFTDTAQTVDVRPGGALVSASAAVPDALTNPTLGQQSVLNSVFNGATWDRQRGMGTSTTTGDTGAKTATGNGATQTNIGNKGVSILCNIGTVSGTTPTMVLKVQASVDGGTTWYDIPGATTATLVATGVWAINIYPGAPTVAGTTTSVSGTASCGQPLPRNWRMVWTIGGTTPSFTITNIQYQYIVN